MKVLEDRSPSAIFHVTLLNGVQRYLAAVALRLGPRFTVSALINQMLPKYLETYQGLDEAARATLEQKARDRFEKTDPVPLDHRMPLHIAEAIRSRMPATAEDKAEFQRTLDRLVLLAAYDFRENGPLKGREF